MRCKECTTSCGTGDPVRSSGRPTRCASSAWLRITATGVRSSWLASAMNRRSWSSLSARVRNADSTCSSMALNARANASTSLPCVSVATRCGSDTPPDPNGSADTSVAVSAILASGRSMKRTTPVEIRATTTNVTPKTRPSMTSSLSMVRSTGPAGSPVTCRSPSRPFVTITR